MSTSLTARTETPAEVVTPTVVADFDLDLTVLPVGDSPDVHRIFASDTQAPCQCSTNTCH